MYKYDTNMMMPCCCSQYCSVIHLIRHIPFPVLRSKRKRQLTMVSLDDVKSTNSKLAIPKLVAVFAGATAGIGSFTLLHFAEHAIRPKIYFLGRSQEQADLLTKQLKEKNAEGEYIFVKADLSSMKNVDQACEKIKQQEKSINILLMSQGALKLGSKWLRFRMRICLKPEDWDKLLIAHVLQPLRRASHTLQQWVLWDDCGWCRTSCLSSAKASLSVESYP